jgi:phospholipase/carboxylesterase
VTEVDAFTDCAPLEIETGSTPVASVIWLHGLGADGHDFEPIVPELDLPESLPLRFVFPHAPYRPVTLNQGYVMRAWYDIALGERRFWQDEAHIRESAGYVGTLIARERTRGLDSEHILLAGFSQGAAIALFTGLCHPQPLAGVMALSMPIPLPERLAAERNAANARMPVFLAHGTQDPIVPYAMGEFGRQVLEQLGVPVEWHSYPMAHTVIPRELDDIRAWLPRVLGQAGA